MRNTVRYGTASAAIPSSAAKDVEETKDRRGIQSIEVGGQLLLALGRTGKPMLLKELAREAGMPSAKGICGVRDEYRRANPELPRLVFADILLPHQGPADTAIVKRSLAEIATATSRNAA